MINNEYLLINRRIVPSVFNKIILAKQLLLSGKSGSVSDAVKKAGISRSAFYKYKDNVFIFSAGNDSDILDITAVLEDKAGILSQVTSELYLNGANILTVNQSMPVSGTATVHIRSRVDNMTISVEKLLEQLNSLKGLITVRITGKEINNG